MEIDNVTEIDKANLGSITRSVRMKIRIHLEKPLKRGTKIKIGMAEPCWLPITYERLPSFFYWCGKHGLTYKDCDVFHEIKENEEQMQEEEFPYGDWLRASPMKFVNVMPANGENTHDVFRRSLFKDDRLH